MAFDPNDHIIQLKSKSGSSDYLPVQWRIVWFRESFPHGTIDTEELEYDAERECSVEGYAWNNETRRSEKIIKTAKGYARYRAIVTDGQGGRATGTKSECAANFADYGEKAETGSIGRALAALGYGTQFAPELNEEHRIVDAPVERTASDGTGNNPKSFTRPATSRQDGQGTDETVNPSIHTQQAQAASESHPEAAKHAPATEQQLASIRKLCSHLGKPEPEDLDNKSYLQAKQLIADLSLEYRQSRKAS